MNKITFLLFLLLPLFGLSQRASSGVYCKNGSYEDHCIWIRITEEAKNPDDPASAINFSAYEATNTAFYDTKEKKYFVIIDGAKAYSLEFKDNSQMVDLFNYDLERSSTFIYTGPIEEPPYEEEEGRVSEEYSEMYDEESGGGYEDPELVGNPHHLHNMEFFNPTKLAGLPDMLIFYDYSNRNRIEELLNPQLIPEATKAKIVGIVEWMTKADIGMLYTVFNEQEQVYEFYTEKNKLLYKARLNSEQNEFTFLDLSTGKVLGTMRLTELESAESTPAGIIMMGQYTIEGSDGQLLSLSMMEGEVNLPVNLYFPSSPYGRLFEVRYTNLDTGDRACFLAGEQNARYELTSDKTEAGKIYLTDLSTKKVVTANYIFE